MERSFGTCRSEAKVKAGRWYYEVELLTPGLFQIGWATNAFTPNSAVCLRPTVTVASWSSFFVTAFVLFRCHGRAQLGRLTVHALCVLCGMRAPPLEWYGRG